VEHATTDEEDVRFFSGRASPLWPLARLGPARAASACQASAPLRRRTQRAARGVAPEFCGATERRNRCYFCSSSSIRQATGGREVARAAAAAAAPPPRVTRCAGRPPRQCARARRASLRRSLGGAVWIF
jgi:hypothetical protein